MGNAALAGKLEHEAVAFEGACAGDARDGGRAGGKDEHPARFQRFAFTSGGAIICHSSRQDFDGAAFAAQERNEDLLFQRRVKTADEDAARRYPLRRAVEGFDQDMRRKR